MDTQQLATNIEYDDFSGNFHLVNQSTNFDSCCVNRSTLCYTTYNSKTIKYTYPEKNQVILTYLRDVLIKTYLRDVFYNF